MTEIQPISERSFFVKIFLSPDEPRLRAGWRISIHSILYNLLLVGLATPVVIATLAFNISPDNLLLNGILPFLPLLISVFLARHFLDRRKIDSIGLKLNSWAVIDIFAGIVITFFMMGVIFVIEISAGWLTFEQFAWQDESTLKVVGNTILFFVIFIFVGWNEELLYRGYRLQNLADGLNPFWGVVLSSLWFGIAHLGNPNTDAKIFVAIGILLAGVFLAYGYLSTKQLWLPIGLHIGWNFFEGVVFGFPVSGLDIYQLTRITVSGPELWTGGAFGPEAGLVLLPGLAVGFGLIYIYTKFAREKSCERLAGSG